MGKSYLIALVAATLSSCSTLETRLDAASQQQGQAEARVSLPDAPAELTKQVPHAPISEGMEALTALKLERLALSRANGKIARWNAFYGALKENLE